ncbi:MAG: hypothetical protein IKR25_00920 [Muribaculaceae bacterium]|nr:hypothetical protein [Muribaculaceae bacterium]
MKKSIHISEFCPLNSKEAIQKILDEIMKSHCRLSDNEIGQVLLQIKKVRLQLFFKNGIDAINEQTKNAGKNKSRKSKITLISPAMPKEIAATPEPKQKAKTAKKIKKEQHPKPLKAKQSNPLPKKKRLSIFFGETQKEINKRRKIRERNMKTAHLSPRVLNERGHSIIPIYTPMGGKPR